MSIKLIIIIVVLALGMCIGFWFGCSANTSSDEEPRGAAVSAVAKYEEDFEWVQGKYATAVPIDSKREKFYEILYAVQDWVASDSAIVDIEGIVPADVRDVIGSEYDVYYLKEIANSRDRPFDYRCLGHVIFVKNNVEDSGKKIVHGVYLDQFYYRYISTAIGVPVEVIDKHYVLLFGGR